MAIKPKSIVNPVRFEHRGHYLFALISGEEEDLATSQANWRLIANTCKAGNYKRVMIVEEIEAELSFMDQFEFASGLTELGFDGIKTAFVDKKLEQFDNNKFAEDVAVNRGANGRLCRTVEEAEAWLLKP